MKTALAPTVADYQLVFDLERVGTYPVVDAFEQRCGYALKRSRLEDAARVLACPIKSNPPNWQHGRVIYAAARAYLQGVDGRVRILDIGTAKGFSALCLQWALIDSGRHGLVTSLDVIDPRARAIRKTVAEVDGPLTLAEILAPWPESAQIQFVRSTGVQWLEDHPERVHVAFVDGKHDGYVVLQEGRLLASQQMSGDLVIFDDVHLPGVSVGVSALSCEYHLEYMEVLPYRHYAIGVRR